MSHVHRSCCTHSSQITKEGKISDLNKERARLREDLAKMEARLRSGAPSTGNDDKLRLLTQQLDTLNQTVKQVQAKLKEAQVELASKTKAIESSHLLNKKLDKEVQQLKEEASSILSIYLFVFVCSRVRRHSSASRRD